MSKITSIIIDNSNKKYFVGYESGKSKMYFADNLPKTVLDYINSDNAKISYSAKTAEQETAEAEQAEEVKAKTAEAIAEEAEQETGTEAEATETTAEQAETAETAEEAEEQRRKTEVIISDRATAEAEQAEEIKHKIFKIRKNFFIACDVINNTVPIMVKEAITNRSKSFKKDNSVIDIYIRRTAEQAEAEQETATAEALKAKAEAIKSNFEEANNIKKAIYNAKIKAEAIASDKKATAKQKAEAEAEALKITKTKASALATAETATKAEYNNKNFEEIKADFYNAYKRYTAVKKAVTATAKAKAEASAEYAKAIDNFCMILVLAVLKKLQNVVRTGKTAKTKHDTNYYTLFNIKNDLIVSHNAQNKLAEAIESNSNSDSKIKFNTFEIADLFEKSTALDGYELLQTAKTALIEKISEAETGKINVDLSNDNFLDIVYSYTSINKRVWRDIQTVTNIKAVTAEEATEQQKLLLSEQAYNKISKTATAEAEQITAEAIANKITTVYTVTYLSDKVKTFSNIDVPKTAIHFIEHETALKNNCYDKQKNLYLIQKETCIAKEVFASVRSFIQSEKATTTNNSYCYIADVTTITDSNGNENTFETYKQLNKEDISLIYNIKSDYIAKNAEVDRLTDFINSCNFSNNYKIVYNEMLKGNGYRTIAKKHNMKEQTVKSETRAIRKKIMEKSIIGNKQKYLTLKKSIMDINSKIKDLNRTGNNTVEKAEAVEMFAKHVKAIIKKLKLQLKQKQNRNRKNYNIVSVVTADYTVKCIIPTAKNSIKAIASAITTAEAKTNINTVIATAKAEAEATVLEIKKCFSDLLEYKTEITAVCNNGIMENKTAIEKISNIINSEATAEAKEKIKNVVAVNTKTATVLNVSEMLAEATAEASETAVNTMCIVTYIDNTVKRFKLQKLQQNSRTGTAEEAEEAETIINYIKYVNAKATAKTLKAETSIFRNTLLNFAKNETAIAEIAYTEKENYNDLSVFDRFTIAQNNFNIVSSKYRKFYAKKVNSKETILNYRLSSKAITTINDSYIINHNNTENINNITVSYTENNFHYYNNTAFYYILNTTDRNSIEAMTGHIKNTVNIKYSVADNTANNIQCNSNSFSEYKYNINSVFIIAKNSYCYAYNVVNKLIAETTTDNSAIWIIIKPTEYYTTSKTIKTIQQYYYDLNGNRKKHKAPIYNETEIISVLPCVKNHGIFKKVKPTATTFINYRNLTKLDKAFFESMK